MRHRVCSSCREREPHHKDALMCEVCFERAVESFRQSHAAKVREVRAAAEAEELPTDEVSEPMTAADFLYDALGYYPATAQGRNS